MGWFRRKAEPAQPQAMPEAVREEVPETWEALWAVLRGIDPTFSADGVWRFRGELAGRPAEQVRGAGEQLAAAYLLLDTEEGARHAPAPYVGLDRPFGYSEFLRRIDAVVLAGPDAVARVAGDRVAVGSFEPVSGGDGSRYFTPVMGMRPLSALLASELARVWPSARRPSGWSLPAYGPPVAASWPSLHGAPREIARMVAADPTGPWLEIAGDLGDPAGRDGDDSYDGWEVACCLAADAIVRAVGEPVASALPGMSQVMVEVCPPEAASEIPGGLEVTSHPDGAAMARLALSERDLSVRPEDRPAVLTRCAALALLRMRLSDGARAAIEPLA